MREPDIGRRAFIKRAACGGLALAGGGALFNPTKTRAQGAELAWPNRPVRFIVPLAAGGGLDFVARVVGEHLSRGLRQQVFIENRTGAGSTIGIDTAIKSAPDGYSVLVSNDNVASAPHVLRLNVDYAKELVPVSQLGRQVLALAAHPSLGVSSMAELLAAAKERPGLGCATSGVGSNQHVLLEWIVRVAGVKLDHVPYRGAGQAINDLLAGHVQIGLLGPTALIPHYRAGTLRLLAQSSETRSPSLPEVPTLQEAGWQRSCWNRGMARSCRWEPRNRSSPGSTPSSTRRWPAPEPVRPCSRPRPNRWAVRPSSSHVSYNPTPQSTPAS